LSTAGLLTQATGADGGRALGGTHIGEGGPAIDFEDGASTGLALSPPQAIDAAPASSLADTSVDVDVDRDGGGDGAYILPGHPSDGSAADRADLDAETPCAALAQCCSRLIVAPPLAAACYVTTQSDGGAGACGSTLATFQDSGLCP
jgi:hypothetical protein